jgi:ATP-dependent Clp endopeptidase proteolytic subunit ClpP
MAVRTYGTELHLNGTIGDDITAEQVTSALASLSGKRVKVFINSIGGSVSDGIEIYSALKKHSAGVDTVVYSLAASIASVVMLAGQNRTIGADALVMIHNPWTIAAGDSSRMRKNADVLDKHGETMVNIYARTMKASVAEIKAMMESETWLNADEALELGLATIVERSESKVAARSDAWHYQAIAAKVKSRC